MLLQLIAWKTIICSNELAALASSEKRYFSKEKTDLKLFPQQSPTPPLPYLAGLASSVKGIFSK